MPKSQNLRLERGAARLRNPCLIEQASDRMIANMSSATYPEVLSNSTGSMRTEFFSRAALDPLDITLYNPKRGASVSLVRDFEHDCLSPANVQFCWFLGLMAVFTIIACTLWPPEAQGCLVQMITPFINHGCLG